MEMTTNLENPKANAEMLPFAKEIKKLKELIKGKEKKVVVRAEERDQLGEERLRESFETSQLGQKFELERHRISRIERFSGIYLKDTDTEYEYLTLSVGKRNVREPGLDDIYKELPGICITRHHAKRKLLSKKDQLERGAKYETRDIGGSELRLFYDKKSNQFYLQKGIYEGEKRTKNINWTTDLIEPDHAEEYLNRIGKRIEQINSDNRKDWTEEADTLAYNGSDAQDSVEDETALA